MLAENNRLEPILKWPGGKSHELDLIWRHLPNQIDRYFEPFLGGGAVYLSIPTSIPAYVNDISTDLMSLYRSVAQSDAHFYKMLANIAATWNALQAFVELHADALLNGYHAARSESALLDDLIGLVNQPAHAIGERFGYDAPRFMRQMHESLQSKMKRMRKLERVKGTLPDADILHNIEGAFKAAFYTHVRYLYNHSERYRLSDSERSALFFFIRENAYAAMFRFNKQGHFNIPYGGISYNRKDIRTKVTRMQEPRLLARLQNTTFENLDFAAFLATHPPRAEDFLFIDPPYDTEFSDYDQNVFGKRDQERLAHYLIRDCPARFMVVIQATEFVYSLYAHQGLTIDESDKKYMYTVKERNNRDAVHLMIRNY